MDRHCVNKVKSLLQWGKILFPLSSLRFYPPQFILRNPVLEGVMAALRDGHEVGVVFFYLKNMSNIPSDMKLMKDIKTCFRQEVLKGITSKNIITLHDFYGEGLTLFIKLDDESHCIAELDYMTKTIAQRVENSILELYPSFELNCQIGFMFIDRKEASIQDAVARAHRGAIAMAEKRVRSDYNDMVNTINRIIRQKGIRIFAQPIINVSTNEIHAFEYLTRGPIGTELESPLQLFSVARQTDRLYDLEMMVIEKSFEQIRATRPRQNIFINCTPLTMENIRFPGDIKRLLQKFSSIIPSQITFEVTEHDSIDGLKNFIYNLKLLRLMGFQIAVDDTGAGYSSLSTIGEIMPEIIKIDRSVIENIDQNSIKESMLKGLMLVAREAGSLVVAEGIENEAEASVLTRNKVDLAQGFFYAPPAAIV